MHINLDNIANKTLEIFRKHFDRDLFVTAHVISYNLDVMHDHHILDVSITIPMQLWEHQITKLSEIMREINCNGDMQEFLTFEEAGLSFMIGDGDDAHSCRITTNKNNLCLLVWVRHLKW